MILIATNNPRLAKRWSRALRGKYASCVVSHKPALTQTLSSLKTRVLLLDVGLPRLRTARDLPSIQRLSPPTKIIILSAALNTNEAIAVLKAGAKGYCDHRISGALLQKATRAAIRGELWAGRKIVSELVEEMISTENRRTLVSTGKISFDGLSPRKRQIAALVVEGIINKEIANRLNISEATVKAHVTGIFRRFKVSRRLDLERLFAAVPLNGPTPALPTLTGTIPRSNRR
jgi:two-component system, NarL family, nitrate/nitrite response regulator NarL